MKLEHVESSHQIWVASIVHSELRLVQVKRYCVLRMLLRRSLHGQLQAPVPQLETGISSSTNRAHFRPPKHDIGRCHFVSIAGQVKQTGSHQFLRLQFQISNETAQLHVNFERGKVCGNIDVGFPFCIASGSRSQCGCLRTPGSVVSLVTVARRRSRSLSVSLKSTTELSNYYLKHNEGNLIRFAKF